MTKKTLKMLSILGAMSAVGAGYASAVAPDCGPCPNAMFVAKGCETRLVSIGGLVTANYEWRDVKDHTYGPTVTDTDLGLESFNFGNHEDPDQFSQFYMKHIRLFVRAELCDNWGAFMSVDFAGRDRTTYVHRDFAGIRDERVVDIRRNTIDSDHTCRDRLPIFIDRAYIEKKWCASTLRVGYQKVNFGAEEAIPDEYVKTIHRSVATHYFMNLGHRAVAGQYVPGYRNVEFGGGHFADRHVGIYLSGDACNFHYNLAVVNGDQGLCRRRLCKLNNDLGYFAGLAYESCVCDVDILLGINGGYKPDGGSFHRTDALNDGDNSVWGLNPYILANWNCFSFLAEMLYGSVENARLTNLQSDANPWGFNFIPSYMINDCWELVARISYLNTNRMGTSINNTLGATPGCGDTQFHNGTRTRNNTFLSSEPQFNKVTTGYIGINFYTVNHAVKATLGYECAKFKNRFDGPIGGNTPGQYVHDHVMVNSVGAQLQLLF